MAGFLKEYFYDMSDRLGGYPAGGDNTRSNTARWVDILNGLAFLPMQQQNAGMPGMSLPGLPGMSSGVQSNYGMQQNSGFQNNSEATKKILSEIYNNENYTDEEKKQILSALFGNNY